MLKRTREALLKGKLPGENAKYDEISDFMKLTKFKVKEGKSVGPETFSRWRRGALDEILNEEFIDAMTSGRKAEARQVMQTSIPAEDKIIRLYQLKKRLR